MRKRVFIFLFFLGVYLAFMPVYGAKWKRAGKRMKISVLALVVTENYIFAGSNKGVFRSKDDGANWIPVDSGMPKKTLVMCLAASGSKVFAGTIGHGIFLSADNGTNWTPINLGLADLRIMSLLADGEKIFAATMGGGIFLSTDSGISWMTASSGLPKATSINCLYKSDHRFFAGTSHGGFYLSTDNAASWKEIKSIISPRNPVSCMTKSGGDLIAGTVEGIFKSTDGGLSWVSVIPQLESILLGSIAETSVMCLAANEPYIFAGTDGAGVYVSSNTEIGWDFINSGLKNTRIYALAVKGDYLYAGTFGDGIWRLPLSKVSIKEP